MVRDLVYDLMAEGVESVVPKTVRETVKAVQKLAESNPDGVNYKQVADELNLDKSSANRRCKTGLKLGYLENKEERKYHSAKLVVGIPLPDDVQLLPTVEELHGCMVARQTGGVSPPPSTDESFDLSPSIDDWPEEWRESYEERISMMQYDGGLSEEDAEKAAEQSTREIFKQEHKL